MNQKHPHGRGEDPVGMSGMNRISETPPRAWGRHLQKGIIRERSRNTPTGVGKTLFSISISIL